MPQLDAIYTPPWLADELLQFADTHSTGIVVDPCAGEGALLKAAERRLGSSAELLGIDVRPTAVAKLRAMHPDWLFSAADLLNPRSVASSKVGRKARGNTELLLLNPPFSYRGQGGLVLELEGVKVRVSPALGFVLTALAQFRPKEGALCILPTGSVFGERNELLWGHLHSRYTVEILADVPNSVFAGYRAKTVLVRVRRRDQAAPVKLHAVSNRPQQTARCVCIDVVRGRVPRHLFVAGAHDSARFIHTTDLDRLAQGDLFSWPARGVADKATVGPFVALNRVGRFHAPVRVPFAEAVLSDCLFALRTVDPASESQLFESLSEYESDLRRLYEGTGAPYITVRRLLDALESIGWKPQHVSADSEMSACSCRPHSELHDEPAERLVGVG